MKDKKVNQWFSSIGQRAFLYDTIDKNGVLDIKQCIARYNFTNHTITLNYILRDYADEYHSQIQLERWIRKEFKTSKCIVSVEIRHSSKVTDQTKITAAWLCNYEPSVELMLRLEERIKQLPITAKFNFDKNYYYQHLNDQNEEEDTDTTSTI